MTISEEWVSVALNVKQVIEIDRFVGLKSSVGKKDNLILIESSVQFRANGEI